MTTASPIILPYNGIMPKIHPTAFIAPGAVIVGDVEIGEESSIWFGAVLRADINNIRIGARTNVQDGTVIHVSAEGNGTVVGNDVTIGHMALLHACIIEDHAFVGMKSSVMDGAKIESYGVLAAGALLTPHKTLAGGQLWAGSPAKFWRIPEGAEREEFRSRAAQYAQMAKSYLAA